MSNSKTVARVALAVAVPGALLGIAAPAAGAAELPSTAKAAEAHLSDAQHTSIAGAQHRATASAHSASARTEKAMATSAHQATSKAADATPHGDAIGSNLLDTHPSFNGKSVDLPA